MQLLPRGPVPALMFVLLLLTTTIFAAAGEQDVPLRITSTTDVMNVDGVLNEAFWANALRVELNYETSPGENVAPPVRTEVFLIHNAGYLYIGFKAYDPDPSAIRAHYRDRDDTMGEDAVNIILDTFTDEIRGFEFECNALGIQRDTVLNDAGDGESDESWDVIWDSAGQIFDWGYSVEMAIPFNALSFPKTDGEQVWGFIAGRDYPRNVRYNIRNVPEDRSRNCTICQAARMVGFEGITPGRNIEITPTLTGTRFDMREDFPDGDMVNQTSETDAGVTATWGITPNINLTVTLNPDFSQVEADAYQLEINRQFALEYEEKRQFFLEGREFFDTPLNAVYTRSIVDPKWGVKLSGKEGANAFSAYVTRDEVTHLLFPGPTESESITLDTESTTSVVRYRRDILENSTIGLLFTDRESGEYYNRLFGVDGIVRVTEQDAFIFQSLHSSTNYDIPMLEDYLGTGRPHGDRESVDMTDDELSDWGHELRYEHSTRNWEAGVRFQEIGDDFRADLGHITRAAYKGLFLNVERMWYGDDESLVTEFSVEGEYNQLVDLNDVELEREFQIDISLEGANQTRFSYELASKRETFETLRADLLIHEIHASITRLGFADLELNIDYGDEIDYRHIREGKRLLISPEMTLHLGKHLKVDVDHQWTRFSVNDERLYLANVVQSKVVYQFNARTFIRSIFQYVDIRRNQNLYAGTVMPVSKQLFTQVLFSYKINPRTVLFLGYSDNYRANDMYDLTQSDRALFMKIGYAWQL